MHGPFWTALRVAHLIAQNARHQTDTDLLDRHTGLNPRARVSAASLPKPLLLPVIRIVGTREPYGSRPAGSVPGTSPSTRGQDGQGIDQVESAPSDTAPERAACSSRCFQPSSGCPPLTRTRTRPSVPTTTKYGKLRRP